MGKRKADNGGKRNHKKFKASAIIEPNTTGIYATCTRGKEKGCVKELMNLFTEKAEEYYDLSAVEDDEETDGEEPKELSIEDQIKKEVEDLKDTKSKKSLFSALNLECECLVFIKTKKPIEPELFCKKVCQDSFRSKIKTTRFTQKLTPVTFTVSASIEELKKLCTRVLAPHFHQENDQVPVKFAINVTRRNFNAIEKDVIIKTVAEMVGRDHGHSVDLKNYHKLILIECYKTSIGMSVVDDYEKLCKYNLQQIYEKST
ncbi:hypothetical protein PSN45_002635 [Yamadazyma tenuis]|uniref:THUMP domain-containing protein n=1 Tax=Candida tenuis (strain ATCC 10573 / BCRC 21748 / CBS 615 / JCM 9827 / NBRC 10315 / NRRL Y-1498 / VKM Y-70) TaxID=590646 RepID=G3AZS1_CANTC|nr:uncharacterized protein CANTEDRAFT_97162 [Yamadazyma tenuis ATCC 10573]EGV65226.1 hypothetical protein CANTEDRAFT_97162 [Yamadazyma tenuis ATCC 10573]WEJ95123.1 hypothetical protein PSN45_002635 [Yamadazyma tenuis]